MRFFNVRRQRLASFTAREMDMGTGPTKVTLVAGPWAGETVTVPGVPSTGSPLDYDRGGLMGMDVQHGHYVVTDVDGDQATASWQLDS